MKKLTLHWRKTTRRCTCRLCDWDIDPSEQTVFIQTRAGGSRVEVFICEACLAELPAAIEGLNEARKFSVGTDRRKYEHEYLPEPDPMEQG